MSVTSWIMYVLDRTPVLMVPIMLYWLQPKQSYQLLFLVYWVLNVATNAALKRYFEQPRPMTNLSLFYRRLQLCKDCMDSNEFGMPSGHAQTFAFCCLFAFFVVSSTTSRMHSIPSDKELFFPYLLFLAWILTCLQRVIAKRHTILQVIMGSLVGFFFGLSLFFFFSDWKTV